MCVKENPHFILICATSSIESIYFITLGIPRTVLGARDGEVTKRDGVLPSLSIR